MQPRQVCRFLYLFTITLHEVIQNAQVGGLSTMLKRQPCMHTICAQATYAMQDGVLLPGYLTDDKSCCS